MGGAKTILGQMFGTQRLNAKEDGEVMLGYDLYSSALANILTEPSLSMPITVGLYAKWGSGTKAVANYHVRNGRVQNSLLSSLLCSANDGFKI